jgi:hypothetical protein
MAGKGGAMPGAGRPRGSRNKRTLELQERIAATGLTPLDYMLSVLRDETNDVATRLEAAKAAAPFVHARLNAIDLNAEIISRAVLKSEPLTPEEWAAKHGGRIIEHEPAEAIPGPLRAGLNGGRVDNAPAAAGATSEH